MFFIKQKRAYEMRSRDGSSDVGSSDLRFGGKGLERRRRRLPLGPWDLREAAAAGRRSRGLLAHFSDEGLRAEEDLMAKLLPQPQAVLGFDVCQSPRRRRVGIRSEERRVGKECVSTCRSRWSPYN